MDTKSKNSDSKRRFLYRKWVRAVAWIVLTGCLFLSNLVAIDFLTYRFPYFQDVLEGKEDYLNSSVAAQEVSVVFDKLIGLALIYNENTSFSLQQEKLAEYIVLNGIGNPAGTVNYDSAPIYYSLTVKNQTTNQMLTHFNLPESLSSDFFIPDDCLLFLQNQKEGTFTYRGNLKSLYLYDPISEIQDFTLAIRMDKDVLSGRQAAFIANVAQCRSDFFILLWGAGIALILLIYLLITSGRRDAHEKPFLYKMDRVFTEVSAAAGVCCVYLLLYLLSFHHYLYPLVQNVANHSDWSAYLLFASAYTIIQFLFVGVLLSMIRKVKCHCFISTSLLFFLIKKLMVLTCPLRKKWKTLRQKIREIFRGIQRHPLGKAMLYQRLIVFAGCLGLILFSFVFFPSDFWMLGILILFSALGLFLWWRYNEYLVLKDISLLMVQTEAVSSGDFTYRPSINEPSPVYPAYVQLCHIGENFEAAVQRQIRAERMKIDLVTNVSHDLKTPLTSIIGYVDLLDKEDLSPVAKDYVSVLKMKSERLQTMVQDLFTLAKSTSGNDDSHPEPLDLGVLLRQVLGDMEDRISHSPCKLKCSLPEMEIPLFADGDKLYRIFQNLLDNSLKYALPGTRIHLTAETDEKEATVCLANVSKYEIDYHPEDILERFTRGDASRTTEGNGLGLSIAKSFTESQGGTLDLLLDGDVFKVTLSFPLKK